MYEARQNKEIKCRTLFRPNVKMRQQFLEKTNNATIKFCHSHLDSFAPNTYKNKYSTVQRIIHFSENDSDENAIIDYVEIKRPDDTSGGNHSTAFVLFIQEIYTALLNNTYNKALNNLFVLGQQLQNYPGFFQELNNPINEYLTKINMASSELPRNWAAALESLSSQYLHLRNLLNYTYHETGWGENSAHGEGTAINALFQTLCNNPNAQDEIAGCILQLFDYKNCKQHEKEEYLKWEFKIRNLWLQHIMTTKSAFPQLTPDILNYATQKFASEVEINTGRLNIYFM